MIKRIEKIMIEGRTRRNRKDRMGNIMNTNTQ